MSHTETSTLEATTPKMNTSETDIHQIEDDLNRLIKRKNKNKALTQNNRDSRIIRWHFYTLNPNSALEKNMLNLYQNF